MWRLELPRRREEGASGVGCSASRVLGSRSTSLRVLAGAGAVAGEMLHQCYQGREEIGTFLLMMDWQV